MGGLPGAVRKAVTKHAIPTGFLRTGLRSVEGSYLQFLGGPVQPRAALHSPAQLCTVALLSQSSPVLPCALRLPCTRPCVVLRRPVPPLGAATSLGASHRYAPPNAPRCHFEGPMLGHQGPPLPLGPPLHPLKQLSEFHNSQCVTGESGRGGGKLGGLVRTHPPSYLPLPHIHPCGV